MPLYEYHCTECEHIFEVIQKFSDPELSSCTQCGGRVEKVLSAPAIRFRGSGWYVNDYARKSSNGSSESSSEGSEAKKSESSGKASSSEKTGETKGDSSGSGANGKSKVA